MIRFLIHDLQDIQFLEFMGGCNLTHAHSNYLNCMLFIRINTVVSHYHIKFWKTEAAIDGQHAVEQLSTPTINFIPSLYPQTYA